MNELHDVAVVGAGPGGSAAAHYLAQQGLKVLLLDRAEFPRDKTCGDGLTPRAASVLKDMGLLDELLVLGRRVTRFEVIAPDGAGTSAPIPGSDTLPAMSLVVPRLLLDDRIRMRALSSSARFEAPVKVTGFNAGESGVDIQADGQGRVLNYRAQILILATGANSALLTESGILTRPPESMVAARAYFEGVRDLGDVWQLRFDGVPLPGYGWIFPTGDGTANIGAGYFARGRSSSAAKAFQRFVANPALRPMLASARQVGAMKGYPLRADFTTAPTWSRRVLLVGEAAGLVNPLTGEGIDYALESGRIAARHIAGMFARGDFSDDALRAYDAELREHFQSLFEFCMFVRDRLCDKAWLLNGLVRVANRRADLRLKLATVVLGGRAIRGKLTARRVIKALIGRNPIPRTESGF